MIKQDDVIIMSFTFKIDKYKNHIKLVNQIYNVRRFIEKRYKLKFLFSETGDTRDTIINNKKAIKLFFKYTNQWKRNI